jgi:hypothetical protein
MLERYLGIDWTAFAKCVAYAAIERMFFGMQAWCMAFWAQNKEIGRRIC